MLAAHVLFITHLGLVVHLGYGFESAVVAVSTMCSAVSCHRPGFCLQHVSRYNNLIHGTEDVESCLMDSFAEHLNAEVVLDTIRDVSMAIQWLKTTFMWQRVRRNPAHYKARAAASGMVLSLTDGQHAPQCPLTCLRHACSKAGWVMHAALGISCMQRQWLTCCWL